MRKFQTQQIRPLAEGAQIRLLIPAILIISIFGSTLVGCDFNLNQTVSQAKAKLVELLTGKPVVEAMPAPSPSALSAGAIESIATARRNLLLNEMYLVIFNEASPDRTEFTSWMDALNAGASFEGVYNGLVHSAHYRQMEIEKRGASAEAISIFAEELAILENSLATHTVFTAKSAQPPAPISLATFSADAANQASSPDTSPDNSSLEYENNTDNGDGAFHSGDVALTPVVTFHSQGFTPAPSPTTPSANPAEYAKLFIGASIYTLKRILGEEVIKVMNEKNLYKGDQALWFSKWAIRIHQRGIDFGSLLPDPRGPVLTPAQVDDQSTLRNSGDENAQFKWVMENTPDRLAWEVLNRIHRIMNHANLQKQ